MTVPANRPRTILVVDDFDDTRLLLRTWLERKGFRVIEAEDGLQAVAVAQKERPDLIIMDLEMPRLDGLTATRRIRKVNEPKVPMIYSQGITSFVPGKSPVLFALLVTLVCAASISAQNQCTQKLAELPA